MKKDKPVYSDEFEIGIFTLGDYTTDAVSGNKVSETERIEEIIEAGVLAEKMGLDVYGVGESHQEHFVSQSHALILSAIARETEKIRLISTASVLSTSDPVRVYEDFSTLDILSKGRAEIVAGRASRVGVFDLLGYKLEDYEGLFEEKIELLKLLNEEHVINWEGKYRPALKDAVLYPKPIKGSIPIWRAVGGAPASAMKAGSLGVPMMLATLGGPTATFKESVDAFRAYAEHYGHEGLPVGITALFHAQDTPKDALRSFYPYVDHVFRSANGSGFSKQLFAQQIDRRAVMLVGDVEGIIEKILYQYELYKHNRLMLQLDVGGLPFEEVKRQIEIVGKEIAPRVRKAIKEMREKEAHENTGN